MKMKKIIKKAPALLLAALMVVSAVSAGLDSQAAAKSIASFGKSGLYRWKWTFCDSYKTFESTGIMKDYHPVNKVEKDAKGDYTFVITSENDKYYFANSPVDDEEYWSGSGAVSDSSWFEADRNSFMTRSRMTSNVIAPTKVIQGGAAAAFNILFDNGKYYRYDEKSGAITKGSTNEIFGLGNDGVLDWTLSKGKAGEEFSFYYKNAKDIPKGNNFYGRDDGIRIAETSSTSYIWASYTNGQTVSETKKSDLGIRSVFHLWIGHFENIPGLEKGSYYIPNGKTLCMDDDVALIPEGSILMVKDEAVLYVKGTLYVEGALDNYGTVIIEDGGSIVIGNEDTYGKFTNWGIGTANGNCVIQQGGRLIITSHDVYTPVPDESTFLYDYTKVSFTGGNLSNNGDLIFKNKPQNTSFSGACVTVAGDGRVVIPDRYANAAQVENDYLKTSGMYSYSKRGQYVSE